MPQQRNTLVAKSLQVFSTCMTVQTPSHKNKPQHPLLHTTFSSKPAQSCSITMLLPLPYFHLTYAPSMNYNNIVIIYIIIHLKIFGDMRRVLKLYISIFVCAPQIRLFGKSHHAVRTQKPYKRLSDLLGVNPTATFLFPYQVRLNGSRSGQNWRNIWPKSGPRGHL